jgi:hypothetical protein
MKLLSELLRSKTLRSPRALSGLVDEHAVVMRAAARSVAQHLGDREGAVVPPEEVLGIRTRVLEQWTPARSFEAVELRLRKRIPAVLFVPVESPEQWVAGDEELCSAFLKWVLEKRRSSVATAAVRAFLRVYPRGLATFEGLRRGLRETVVGPGLARPGTLLATVRESGHLEPDGPTRIATKLLETESRATPELAGLGLGGALQASAFEYAVFSEVASVLEQRSPGLEPRLVARCLELVETEPGRLRLGDPLFRARLISSLLTPLARREPERPTRDALFRFCLGHLGDPRSRDARWSGVSPAARDVMVRWLVQESFDIYFSILDSTADDRMWSYRRPFWEHYLRRGDVIDAWAVLGRAAAEEATRRKVRRDSYGVMRTGDKYQSALLMRLRGTRGVAVVAEWSHNGSCRLWSNDRSHVPPFYRRDYDPDTLRRNPELQIPHNGSEHGRWQSQILFDLSSRFGIGA